MSATTKCYPLYLIQGSSFVTLSLVFFICVAVLVVSDKIVNQMEIQDATCVIHFDVPSQQTLFANRLWCCRSNFHKLVKSVEV